MSSLVIESVSKQWGNTHALHDVSFAADAGSLVVLLGPSGCGKSTLLRMIAGLDTPSTGRILLGGTDVTGLPPARRKLSMVFQSYALFPHLSVRENLLFGLRVRGEPARDFPQRLARVASLLGLEPYLERKPSQLSGGQQQRVALGRAVIAETSVCLMDEPLSNLDAQLRQEMRREIRALQQQLGMTLVYVTHDQTEAMSMADQVVLLRNGRIEQRGAPHTLYATPATRFAASFIGTPPMQLLRLVRHGDALVPAGQTGPALATALSDTQDAALLGVRPEHVRAVPPTSVGAVLATVSAVEYLGADTLVACTLGDAGEVATRVPGHRPFAPGEAIGLQWDAADQHLFDAASGARLAGVTANWRTVEAVDVVDAVDVNEPAIAGANTALAAEPAKGVPAMPLTASAFTSYQSEQHV
ncbi:ABC transporter ATP-binding protein [Pandoraea apista]|uniref:ABC transporter ATP-binding protein n=1 Tax=Pandoraea apista TaxID=93218 RepID=A0A5E5PDS9_9BURK|nr:ABC transporter ATP-binding protein [Pandoraea apista]OXS93272.1 ABC transporter ATP-binding protein [Pandoraea apista]VVG74265.1 ABC transporter ATP-binding protein [Pandoraea apista]